MELIRFIAEMIVEWMRDTAVNLSSRLMEDVVGKRVSRRRRMRKTNGRTRTKPKR
jgi:hypothetical protein